MHDVDNHTSKCTHSHWPLHLVSCQDNLPYIPKQHLPYQSTATKCWTSSVPHCARERGNAEYNVLCTILLCECAWHCVCICMRRCEYNMYISVSLFAWNCVGECKCAHIIILLVYKISLNCSQMQTVYNFSHTINPWTDKCRYTRKLEYTSTCACMAKWHNVYYITVYIIGTSL